MFLLPDLRWDRAASCLSCKSRSTRLGYQPQPPRFRWGWISPSMFFTPHPYLARGRGRCGPGRYAAGPDRDTARPSPGGCPAGSRTERPTPQAAAGAGGWCAAPPRLPGCQLQLGSISQSLPVDTGPRRPRCCALSKVESTSLIRAGTSTGWADCGRHFWSSTRSRAPWEGTEVQTSQALSRRSIQRNRQWAAGRKFCSVAAAPARGSSIGQSRRDGCVQEQDLREIQGQAGSFLPAPCTGSSTDPRDVAQGKERPRRAGEEERCCPSPASGKAARA